MGDFRDQPTRQCAGKHTYLTKAEAKQAVKRALSRFGVMRAYRCPHCSRYHIGHDPKQRAVQRRREERRSDS